MYSTVRHCQNGFHCQALPECSQTVRLNHYVLHCQALPVCYPLSDTASMYSTVRHCQNGFHCQALPECSPLSDKTIMFSTVRN
ncbi:hypothetical protein DPMN_140487 [Dreissena polymorpha]|uniref:Uncharacterized protein n=1 Tax=Dreissena polymorpha TaxID=45954 RepID=A0A9D4G7P5_DREPO|nr:hypothetical protein DPMN_140487 [Dreissena polymorpha]